MTRPLPERRAEAQGPPLTVGSSVAHALHDLWSGRRATTIAEPSTRRQVEAVATLAAALWARTRLSVTVAAPNTDLAGDVARQARQITFDDAVVTGGRLGRPDESDLIFVSGRLAAPKVGVEEIMSASHHSQLMSGDRSAARRAMAAARDSVTIVLSERRTPTVDAWVWSATSDAASDQTAGRLVVVGPGEMFPRTAPQEEYRLGEVPFDITIAGER